MTASQDFLHVFRWTITVSRLLLSARL